MVFYQALLLAGYYYAHVTSTRLPTRRQVAVHTGLLLVTAGALAVGAALIPNHSPVPVVKSLAPQGSSVPFFGVIALLTAAIGLPFFTVSATAPLLQKWFSETGHPSAKDPYFLYAASNCGSLLALLAYPFVVEPNLPLVEQAWVWAAGFALLIVLIAWCGNAVKTTARPRPANPGLGTPPAAPPPRWPTKVRWMLLAAVPSSLMLATTTDVTTDIVSMPLLWIVPLALYLLTFVIVFSKTVPAKLHLYVTLMTPVVVLLMVFLKISGNIPESELSVPFKLIVGLELLAFFMVALTCHGELARTRPSTAHLTEFYLIMSFGGMLGGLFNALVAPIAFTFITEYPISLVAACFLLPPIRTLLNPEAATGIGGRSEPESPTGRAWIGFWDVFLMVIFLGVSHILSNSYDVIQQVCGRVVRSVGSNLPSNTVATVVVFGLPTLVCYFLVERPVRFGLCVAALWLGTYWTFTGAERKVPPEFRTYYTRSFFGQMKVDVHSAGPPWFDPSAGETLEPASHPFRRLIHGTTVHGSQPYQPAAMSESEALWLLGANGPADALALAWIAQPNWEFPHREPITYYHRTGPVGEMFQAFWDQTAAGNIRTTDVGCVGLGTGSSSAYGRPGQKLTFFEIDQTVARLVKEPRYFTYIDEALKQGVNVEFVMGDARLSLEQTDRKWGILLVDAFSSDSIPAHLLTKEALELYMNRLDENGLLALHISNRYLRLEPVVDRIVRESGYDARVMHDFTLQYSSLPYAAKKPEYSGKYSSSWVVVGRTKEALAPFYTEPTRWQPLEKDDTVGLWTDDYTPIKNVLQGDWAFIRIFSE
jgi:hypothetical protein